MNTNTKLKMRHGYFFIFKKDITYAFNEKSRKFKEIIQRTILTKTRDMRFTIELPVKFQLFLLEKLDKWKVQNIEFSIGYQVKEGLIYFALSIVHPRDRFNSKIGRAIVKGRMLKLLDGGYGYNPPIKKPRYIDVRILRYWNKNIRGMIK